MYIAPGQGQTAPRGQNLDVNRKALSLYPFVASFKEISLKSDFIHFFSSPEPKAHKVSLQDRTRAGVRVCVRLLTISNMNISKTRGPIATKFYLKHHWGGGKPALGFGPGRIRTLVSMATDSSHRVIMGKTASPRFLDRF